MKACAKHAKEPVKGYAECPGCEVESLRQRIAELEQTIKNKDYASKMQQDYIAELKARIDEFEGEEADRKTRRLEGVR